MIKKLRIKIVCIAMAALGIAIALVFGALNLYMVQSENERIVKLMDMVAKQDGVFPTMIDKFFGIEEESLLFGADYRYGGFVLVRLNKKNEVIGISADRETEITADRLIEYINKALSSGKEQGKIGSLRYLVREKGYGTAVVLADMTYESNMLERLASSSVVMLAVSVGVLFVLAVIFSGWAVGPIKSAFEKQKRFIADASHELKTPLTIISASAELLEKESGGGKWIDNIKGQTARMDDLVQDMLELARADDGLKSREFVLFDLSGAVLSRALEFESRAYEEGKKYSIEVEPEIKREGDEEELKKAVGILIDNAIKRARSEVRVKMQRDGSKTVIEVYNDGEGIDESEQEKIFERFYRSDESRSRNSGGYGLGLAIAKSVIDAHGGKIIVKSNKNEWVKFTVVV